MIPLNVKQILEYKDDASGIVYLFKPLVGESELLLDEYLDFIDKRNKPFIPAAELIVAGRKASGEAIDDKETERHIQTEATRLSFEDNETARKHLEIIDRLINECLIGWKADNNYPAFPENKKPSMMFRRNDKIELISAIIKVNELSGNEIKN